MSFSAVHLSRDDEYWGAAKYRETAESTKAADAGAHKWMRTEWEKVRGSSANYRWHNLPIGTAPESWSRTRRTPPGARSPWFTDTYRCPLFGKKDCPARLRHSKLRLGDGGGVYSEIHQFGTHKSHKGSVEHACGPHPTARAAIRKCFLMQLTGPKQVRMCCSVLKVKDEHLPTHDQVRNFEQGERAGLLRDGLRATVAGFASRLTEDNYYAKRGRLLAQGKTWSHSESYVVPGVKLGRIDSSDALIVTTTDAACLDMISNIRHNFGGWLGVDGKHRTNYAGFPIVPLVSKDCNDNYFVVALVLVSSEHGDRIAAAIRLFLAWILHRFPGECDGLPVIEPMVDRDVDMAGEEDDGPASESDSGSDSGFDPSMQEPATSRCRNRAGRAKLRRKWETSMNSYIDWNAMLCGYDTHDRHWEHPRALRVRWGGADNADNYASALAYGAHAKTSNCAVHLLVNNIDKANSTLWKALGGRSEENIRAAVHAVIKLLRDVPCIVPGGPTGSTLEWRDTEIFQVGCELFLSALRAEGWHEAAAAIASEYMSSRRKYRWGGAHFPRYVPNHNCGTESMNATIAIEMARFKWSEVVHFTARMMMHMHRDARLRASPGCGFSAVNTKVETDTKLWRKVHKLVNEVKKPRRGNNGNDDVARLQMHRARAHFMRRTTQRYSIPSAQLLIKQLEDLDSNLSEVVDSLKELRAAHVRLVQNPRKYAEDVQPDVNEYLRLAVRAFYVLERIPEAEVRSKYSQFSCTCPYHRLRSHCKHSIALTIILKLVTVPTHLNFNVMSKLPQRGRKRLPFATVALRNFTDNATFSRHPKSMDTDGPALSGEGGDSGSEASGSDDEAAGAGANAAEQCGGCDDDDGNDASSHSSHSSSSSSSNGA